MSERRAVVASSSGLHARPAAVFTEAAAELDVDVTIALAGSKENEAVAASSILSVMALGAGSGDTLVLRAEGPKAQEALDKLAKLIETDLDAA